MVILKLTRFNSEELEEVGIPSKLFKFISVEDHGVILITERGTRYTIPWHRIWEMTTYSNSD